MAISAGVLSQALYICHRAKCSSMHPFPYFLEKFCNIVCIPKTYSCRWACTYKMTEWCKRLAKSVRIKLYNLWSKRIHNMAWWVVGLVWKVLTFVSFLLHHVFSEPRILKKELSKDFLLVHEIFVGLTIVHLAISNYVWHLDSISYTSGLLADDFMKYKVSSIMVAFYVSPVKWVCQLQVAA